MQVIAPGTKVKIGGTVTGTVTAITILAGGFFRYEVAWWDGNTRTCQWLESYEVELDSAAGPAPLEIGFKP